MNGAIKLQVAGQYKIPAGSDDVALGVEAGRDAWTSVEAGCAVNAAAVKLAQEIIEAIHFEDRLTTASVVYGVVHEAVATAKGRGLHPRRQPTGRMDMTSTENDPLQRAWAEHMKTPGARYPSEAASSVNTVNGRQYVVLRNSLELLGVYRALPGGAVRKLQRWPKVLNDD